MSQHAEREEWSAAADRQRQLADIFGSVFGKTHYRAVDTQIEYSYYAHLAALKREDARALVKADQDSSRSALLYSQGNYSGAIALIHQALEVQERLLGKSSPEVATRLNNLALLYDAQGDYARAEPLYQKVLEIRKKVLGENHPDYATGIANLAHLYHAQGDYVRAEPLFRHASEILKKALGEKHPIMPSA